MRLHRLSLSAFLAFPGTEHVDFDALGEAGLFLLQGRTGAGKTSVLDAVCFAFYGAVPGERQQSARLRSDHATADTLTEVMLEATVRDTRVRILRSPEQERPKLRGDGTTTVPHKVQIVAIDDDGDERVLATRPDEAREVIDDLLGMTREQFCQVVLLPQGGFAKFLHAKSDERAALLSELFDVERFADVEAWLKDRRRAAEREAEESARALGELVARSATTAGAEPPEGWAAAPADVINGWLDEQMVVAEASLTTAGEATREAENGRTAAADALVAGQELAQRQHEQREAQERLAAWESRTVERDRRAARLDAARRAAKGAAVLAELDARIDGEGEAIAAARAAVEGAGRMATDPTAVGRPDEGIATLRANARARRADAGAVGAEAEREARLVSAVDEVARLTAEAERQSAALAGLDAEIAAGEATQAERTAALAVMVRAEAELPGLTQAVEQATQRADRAVDRDAAAADRQRLESAHLTAREEAVAARERHTQLLAARLDGIAGELAARLVDGESCAVCGSTSHPTPAAPPEGGLVTPEAVSAAERHADDLGKRRDALAHELADARNRHAAALAVAGDASAPDLRAAAEQAAAVRDGAAARAAEADATRAALQTLEARVAAAQQRRETARAATAIAAEQIRARADGIENDRLIIEAAREGAPTIAARVQQLTAQAGAAEAAADALEQAQRATAERVALAARAEALAADAGFADLDALRASLLTEEVAMTLDREIRAWDDGVTERRTAAKRPDLVAAAAVAAPDLAALEARAVRAADDAIATQKALALADSRSTGLQELRGRVTDALDEAEPRRVALALITEVAELANGTAASNRHRMRLTAYVLAARLEEVAAAATVRLERMSGGRYVLVHADDAAKGNRRGGLDLRIVDAWTGRERSPATLSGGETFQASLALALGLADVVTAEAGGTRLETLFVDEGFGSLDDEGTLDDVLEMLDGLRDGGRTVGIVSHVAELRQRIPTQLRVEKGRDGSTLMAIGGVAAT